MHKRRFLCPLNLTATRFLLRLPNGDLLLPRSLLSRPISNSTPPPAPPSPFTVSYLVSSWGVQKRDAVSMVEKVRIKDTLKPDCVLEFLLAACFTRAQIAALVTRRPEILAANLRTRLKPKIDFFCNIGLQGPDLAKVLVLNPSILCSGLDTKIIPSADFLRGILGSDDNLVFALKRNPWLLHCNVQKTLAPNVETLRSHGLPDSRISKLLLRSPRCLMQNPDRFAELVDEVIAMGYDPSTNMFIYGLSVISGMSTAVWNRKVAVYRGLGWSDEDILRAFRRHPDFLLKSEGKIREVVGFASGKLGLGPEDVVRYPSLMTYDLERSIIPRCCVLNALMVRGILDRGCNVLAKLHLKKARFLEVYVDKYKDEVPEVVEAYEGKVAFEGFTA